MLRPHRAVPVHYDDYGVFKSPLSDFENEMARRGLSELVEVVPRGATHRLARHRAERLQ
jgi:L-ascorbate metabolism protein UlaG (beta-lactamase superfamily)